MRTLWSPVPLSSRRPRKDSQSHIAVYGQLREDLLHALGDDASLVIFPWQHSYRAVTSKRCNLGQPTPAPAAITFPKHILQVQTVISTAARLGLAIQARSGGHSYGNHSLGGSTSYDTVVIDLHHFQYVHVEELKGDQSSPTARVGGGTRLGHLIRELNTFGLAIPHGTCPSVGIGGHATIGGLGPTSRMWGLTLDHVEEMTVILANGEVAIASEASHPELFFALRGAAASFGIVLEFKFRTRKAPKHAFQFSCMVTARRYTDMTDIFAEWQAMVAAPGMSEKLFSQVIITMCGMRITGTYFGNEDELQSEAFARRFLPRRPNSTKHMRRTQWWAAVQEGENLLLHHRFSRFRIIRHKPSRDRDTVKTVVSLQKLSWPELISEWSGGRLLSKVLGRPITFHAKSCTISRTQQIDTSAIERLFTYLDTSKKGALLWFLIFDLAGGAVADVPADATAFAHRDANIYCQSYVISMICKLRPTSIRFVNTVNAIVMEGIQEPHHDGLSESRAVYPGYVDGDLDQPQKSYWGKNLERLEGLKATYDSENVFRHPQSIKAKHKGQ